MVRESVITALAFSWLMLAAACEVWLRSRGLSMLDIFREDGSKPEEERLGIGPRSEFNRQHVHATRGPEVTCTEPPDWAQLGRGDR